MTAHKTQETGGSIHATQTARSPAAAGGNVPINAIAPCLWFDDQAEEAARGYSRIFPDSNITAITHYPESIENPSGKPRGSVLTVECVLAGVPFTLLNGGPAFIRNQTISFFVHTRTEAETDRIAKALADGGTYLMELGAYQWSPRYAWVQDRYNVSWQVMMSTEHQEGQRIVPCLMFAGDVHGRAEEALRLYADVFPDSTIEALERYTADEGPKDTLKHGRASLGGQRLVVMDSHDEHDARFNEALSLQVMCKDQADVDHYWERLSDGGEEGPCGWLKDRFGVSWQVVPTAFIEMLTRGDGRGPGYDRAFQAMLGMKKLDIEALQTAYEG